MGKTIRMELEMPTEKLAKEKFPEARSQFSGGTRGLAFKLAGIKPSIFLDGAMVVVELSFRSEGQAAQMLPMFEAQSKAAYEKERLEKGECIPFRVFLKEKEVGKNADNNSK